MKSYILEFIRHEGQFICPISHKPLVESDLIPNVVLQETIKRWKDHHHHSSSCSNGARSTDDNNNKDTQTQVPPHASITMDESMELTQTSTTEDSTELGKAINSLSQVFASKEGYCILADETDVQANDDDDLDHLLECGLTRSESSASFLYTMFLPQERQALRRRAREQRHAQRLAWFVKVGYAVSVVLISLVLLLCLAKVVKLLLPVLTTTTTTSTGAWSTEDPATNLSTHETARPTQRF